MNVSRIVCLITRLGRTRAWSWKERERSKFSAIPYRDFLFRSFAYPDEKCQVVLLSHCSKLDSYSYFSTSFITHSQYVSDTRSCITNLFEKQFSHTFCKVSKFQQKSASLTVQALGVGEFVTNSRTNSVNLTAQNSLMATIPHVTGQLFLALLMINYHGGRWRWGNAVLSPTMAVDGQWNLQQYGMMCTTSQ
jgi:hypothetical protein